MRIPKIGDTMYIKDEETGKPISAEVIEIEIEPEDKMFGGTIVIECQIDGRNMVATYAISNIDKYIFFNKEDIEGGKIYENT